MRRDLSLGRVLLIYGLGLMAGAQGALYVYDSLDDGVSEPLSGIIAVGLVVFGAVFIARSFRPRPPRPPGRIPPTP